MGNRANVLKSLAHHGSYEDLNDDGNSSTIFEKLSQLAREEKQISGELERLKVAFQNVKDDNEFKTLLQKYESMLNKKNSLLREQMQFTITKEEWATECMKEKILLHLQEFSDLDDKGHTIGG